MIGVLGLNHTTAKVETRECFVFDEPEIERFIRELQQQEPFSEVVVLSTCNRTEIYFNSPKPCGQRDFSALIRFLCRAKGIEEVTGDLFYTLQEEQAVAHLFRVSSGLNSMVFGENEILGQVKEAYRISASRKFTGAVLNRLFHKAFEVGKTVRTDTSINEGASSVGYAAVELASKIFTNLPEHSVLLIGAGEMGELVLRCLAQRGNCHLHVANRTLERAMTLAEKYGAEALSLDELMEHFVHCDVIIVSTASRMPLVRHGLVQEAMERRHNRSLFLIDLSVPRDVEEKVREMDGVFVYDIDDLEMVVTHNREKRKREIEKAGGFIEAHTREFFDWLSTLDLSPTIGRLKERFQSISQEELGSLKNRLPEETFRKVQEYGDFLEGKYLGFIIKNLKKLSKDGRQPEYVDLVNKLFDLHQREEK
jgi:glutamyl-tRNA reductase